MDRSSDMTICGIATPLGDGGIGIVRISGCDAVSIVEPLVRLRSGVPLRQVQARMLYLADILCRKKRHDGTVIFGLQDGEIIDEGLVVVMEGPRSFTGEDVVEIHCHGGPIVLGLVCEACVGAGARLAEPGEFTKRAFLNGRLDLSQAEAVLDTITARSEASLRLAQRHLRGDLGLEVRDLRNGLLCILGELEAGIDFSDEDITFIHSTDLEDALSKIGGDIQRMLKTADRGIRLRDGARVVVAGRPNVGKSSVLNCLLGEDRAIVTEVPGTTRDVIEESVVWEGFRVVLVDTAGVRDTEDVVEREGIRRTRVVVEDADVLVQVLDASEGQGEEGWSAGEFGSRHPDVIVINKTDLVSDLRLHQVSSCVKASASTKVILTSMRTGEGLDCLRNAIVACVSGESFESDGGVVVTNIRHRDALARAGIAVERALDAVQTGVEPELIVVDVRDSADALGEVTGAITSDEILNHIFSNFCIGK